MAIKVQNTVVINDNKALIQRAITVTTATVITPTADTADTYIVSALTSAATLAAPSGSPVNGQKLLIKIKDDGISRSLTWTTSAGAYRAIGTAYPSSTVAGKNLYVGCVYNSNDGFWDIVAVAQE